MKIMEFLSERAIVCDLKTQTKEGVIGELVELLVRSGDVKDHDVSEILTILKNREALGSTGIGQGVAIPHGKSNAVSHLIGAFGVSKAGVDFGSLDGSPAHLFFLLMAPEDSAGPHLKALARISRLLKDRHFRESLKQAHDEKTILKILADEDQKRH